MATDTPNAGSARTQQRFTFFSHGGRVLARNVDGKLIDLGRIGQAAGQGTTWLLDGNQLTGTAPDVAAALRDVAARAGFLYLDGQFTAVADLREGTAPDLSQAEQVEMVIDELQPGERMEDARV